MLQYFFTAGVSTSRLLQKLSRANDPSSWKHAQATRDSTNKGGKGTSIKEKSRTPRREHINWGKLNHASVPANMTTS